MDSEPTQDIWEVETAGQVTEADLAQITAWIADGSLLRIDRVRRGGLRWIEAGKVPTLIDFFNAKDAEPPPPRVVTTSDGMPDPPSAVISQTVSPTARRSAPEPAMTVCSVHPDAPAAFQCSTCTNLFCKACPSSYGGTVKICPFCGAMCEPVEKAEAKRVESAARSSAVTDGFGFSDFASALAYPFKFKASLIMGAIMFMIFSIGQSASGFGGIFMMGSVISTSLFANMLTFGILAHTVDNFSQGKIGLNFMPDFDDFSFWDDVIQPFFLSIGVYIASFGPFIVLMIAAIFFLVGAVKTEMTPIEDDAARLVQPDLPYAANAAKQSERVKELLNKTRDTQKERVAAIESGQAEFDESYEPNAVDDEEAEFARLDQMIKESRKAQLESAIGKTSETVASERSEMLSRLLGYGAVFVLMAVLSLLWAAFYFPAACAVAGYTRSFAATVNPTVGIDTIRRLGLDYVKILLMCLAIFVISGIIGGALAIIFLPFDLPAMGNLPAKAIGSIFNFYFSVVFSCVIGFALYKASDRLALYR